MDSKGGGEGRKTERLRTLVHILSKTSGSTRIYIHKGKSVLLTQYCAGGKIEKNKMGGACGAYGGGERCAQGSGGETGGKETIGETQT